MMDRVGNALYALRRWRTAALVVFGCAALATPVASQIAADSPASREVSTDQSSRPEVPEKVDVEPIAQDQQIRDRLAGILEATNWFTNVRVRVEDGVVFLDGQTEKDELKRWAGDLARSTQDVAAVVNRIGVSEPLAWDFREAREGLQTLWRDFHRSLPFLVFGFFILMLSAAGGWLTTRSARRFLQRRIEARLLRNVIARAAGMLVFLAGIYVVLRVAGLTQLALTVIGGTGLLGLAVGIAFRDITENFLASIFLSMQRPFGTGDLVEVAGVTGYVQQLNVRTTVLMNLDGNLVQIPNAMVYKNTIRNFTANPNRRESFVVGIGYDDRIDTAQKIVHQVLAEHPAVLEDPEPWILADSFGSATVQLRIYFWLNGHQHSWLKVRSSVIRLVKLAFQRNGISMPDEAREVVFPRGIPVTMLAADSTGVPQDAPAAPLRASPPAGEEMQAASTEAEGGLDSEAGMLEKQAREARPVDGKENLLSGDSSGAPS